MSLLPNHSRRVGFPTVLCTLSQGHSLSYKGGGGDLEPSQLGVGNLVFQFGRQIYHAKSRGQVKILLPRLRRKRI